MLNSCSISLPSPSVKTHLYAPSSSCFKPSTPKMAWPLSPSVHDLNRPPSMDKSLNPLNHSTFWGGGSPKTSKKQKMVSFSVPDHLSHGLSMNLHGPGPLGLSGVPSFSQLWNIEQIFTNVHSNMAYVQCRQH